MVRGPASRPRQGRAAEVRGGLGDEHTALCEPLKDEGCGGRGMEDNSAWPGKVQSQGGSEGDSRSWPGSTPRNRPTVLLTEAGTNPPLSQAGPI